MVACGARKNAEPKNIGCNVKIYVWIFVRVYALVGRPAAVTAITISHALWICSAGAMVYLFVVDTSVRSYGVATHTHYYHVTTMATLISMLFIFILVFRHAVVAFVVAAVGVCVSVLLWKSQCDTTKLRCQNNSPFVGVLQRYQRHRLQPADTHRTVTKNIIQTSARHLWIVFARQH